MASVNTGERNKINWILQIQNEQTKYRKFNQNIHRNRNTKSKSWVHHYIVLSTGFHNVQRIYQDEHK